MPWPTQRIKNAKARYEAAREEYKAKRDALIRYHSETEQRLQELGRVRADGMQAVRKAIDFIRRARLIDPSTISDAGITMPELDQLDQAYDVILKTVGGVGASLAGGAGVGALTALGAYGLVGALGTASTGAAIGGLSGAAASSATLAWFGGGALAAGGLGMAGGAAVLGGIVALPALLAAGTFFFFYLPGKVEKEVNEKISQIRLEEAKIARKMAELKAIGLRCDEVQRTVKELTRQLKLALRKHTVKALVAKIPFLRKRFAPSAKDVYQVAQIAKALRSAIDEPVIPASQR